MTWICVWFRSRSRGLDDCELGQVQTNRGTRRHPTYWPWVMHQWHGHLPSGLYHPSTHLSFIHPPKLPLFLAPSPLNVVLLPCLITSHYLSNPLALYVIMSPPCVCLVTPLCLLIRYPHRRIFFSVCSLGITQWNIPLSPLQGELHVSKLFHHPSILPYKSIFIAENELWVITPFMAYGEEQTDQHSCWPSNVEMSSDRLVVKGLLVQPQVPCTNLLQGQALKMCYH